jgi:hypothetical protein
MKKPKRNRKSKRTQPSLFDCLLAGPTLDDEIVDLINRRGEGCSHPVHLAKKSLPLSSTTMKAGKSTTSMRQIASMPSSG